MDKFSDFDNGAIKIIRDSVTLLFSNTAKIFDRNDFVILDIAPQDHEGAKSVYKKAVVQTLDIDPNSGADYIYDLCSRRCDLPKNLFDVVYCTEVLEHTLNPFDAVNEIFWTLKPGGYLLGTTPFNFRIHGPSPDAFRFTKDGLRSLLRNFNGVDIEAIETPGRPNMPIQYIWSARKPLNAG